MLKEKLRIKLQNYIKKYIFNNFVLIFTLKYILKIIKVNFGMFTIFCYVNQRTLVLCFDIEQKLSNSFGVDI